MANLTIGIAVATDAPWAADAETYRQYAVKQYAVEKQMLDKIGFKPG